jgi:glycosyltransferase involved in cell wall biosynthesis
LKILHVIPVFSEAFGGPVAVVRSMAKELAKRHEVTVYTTTALDTKHDSKTREERIDGYKIIYFNRSLKHFYFNKFMGQINLSFTMLKAIKDHLREFDLVHVHSWQQFPDVLVHKYARKYGVPYILQVHGSLPNIIEKQKIKHLFDILFGKRILQDASMLVATCQLEANQMRAAGVPAKKIAIIHNSLIESQFKNLPLEGSLKRRLGLTEEQKIILYLGRIHKIKGIDTLVKSYCNIIKEFDNTRLVIIGPDDGYLNDLKSLISLLKMENNIIVSGPAYGKEKMEAYVDAEVCVFPSNYEIFGMTTIEACACGKPVITSEVSGIAPEIIVDGETGFLIKPNDIFALSQDLRFILLNGEKARQIGKKARVFALSFFTAKKVIPDLENLYAQICS